MIKLALAVCLLVVAFVFLPVIQGHTVVYCMVKDPCSGEVTVYAGTYHNFDYTLGYVEIAPAGTGFWSLYYFTSYVEVFDDVPDQIPYESCFYCPSSIGYGTGSIIDIRTFQKVSVGNYPIQQYDAFTSSYSVNEEPGCVDTYHQLIYSPRLYCPADATITLSQTCLYHWTFPDPTFNAGCAVSYNLVHLSGPNYGDYVSSGTYYVEWRLDINGVPGSHCSQFVTLVDPPPVVTCPASIVQPSDISSCNAVVNYAVPVFDNCGIVSTTYSQASGTIFNLGTTIVNVVATDSNGQQSSCSFSVTVDDQLDPVVSCPGDITVFTTPGSCQNTVSYSYSASDNCQLASTSINYASPSVFLLGSTKVVYLATDTSGRFAACDFTVTVVDNIQPILGCPGPITVPAVVNQCSAIVTYSMANINDNCAVSSLITDPPSGFDFPVGVTTVQATLIDTSGNTRTCSFTVTVTDPTSLCLCGNGVVDFAAGEACEINQLGTKTCATQGFPLGGVLDCTRCQYDTSRCAVCGDARIDGVEVCDGSNLSGQTCESLNLGFTGGLLACGAQCDQFDTSACTKCGDGTIQGSEQCDGTKLNGQSCATLVGSGSNGVLTCTANCQFNTSSCSVPVITMPTGSSIIDHLFMGIRVKASGFLSDTKVTVTLNDGLSHTKVYYGIALSQSGGIDATFQAPAPLAPSTQWRVSVKGESTLYTVTTLPFTVKAY